MVNHSLKERKTARKQGREGGREGGRTLIRNFTEAALPRPRASLLKVRPRRTDGRSLNQGGREGGREGVGGEEEHTYKISPRLPFHDNEC